MMDEQHIWLGLCSECGHPMSRRVGHSPYCWECGKAGDSAGRMEVKNPLPLTHILSMDCWCGPVRDEVYPAVVIHNHVADKEQQEQE